MDLFSFFVFLTKVAGGAVHASQTIQNSTSDSMLGVTLNLDLFARVEFENGINQAHRAGTHQVVHFNVRRKMRAHFSRNSMQKRKQLHYFPISLGFALTFINYGCDSSFIFARAQVPPVPRRMEVVRSQSHD